LGGANEWETGRSGLVIRQVVAVVTRNFSSCDCRVRRVERIKIVLHALAVLPLATRHVEAAVDILFVSHIDPGREVAVLGIPVVLRGEIVICFGNSGRSSSLRSTLQPSTSCRDQRRSVQSAAGNFGHCHGKVIKFFDVAVVEGHVEGDIQIGKWQPQGLSSNPVMLDFAALLVTMQSWRFGD
jgi:hypothetical protein